MNAKADWLSVSTGFLSFDYIAMQGSAPAAAAEYDFFSMLFSTNFLSSMALGGR